MSTMWCDNLIFTEDYAFKSSPESCSDNSFSTDNVESVSDEDFMTQLSSDLDIPLLLNPGEDEMAVLNSSFDKTPDEILSDISSSYNYIANDSLDIKDFDFLNEVLDVPGDDDNERIGNTNSNDNKATTYFEYLNNALNPSPIMDNLDIKSEKHSDESCSSRNSLEPSTPPPDLPNKKLTPSIFFPTNILPKKECVMSVDSTTVQVVPQSNKSVKVPIKRVPIKPKAPYTVPVKKSNIVFIKNIKTEFPTESNRIGSDNISSNIVVLDSIPVNGFNTIAPSIGSTMSPVNKQVAMPSISVNPGSKIDPKIIKRQERRIKNRESASISRKKKKDYLNSLEEQVKDLTTDNIRLIEENTSLRERLSFYEDGGNKLSFNIAPKGAKPALFLCAFLLVVGLNLNLPSSPFFTKTNKLDSERSNSPKLPDHYSRNLLWSREDNQDEKLKNSTYFSPLTMCPASINQTESARLLLELEKWIGKPEPIKNARETPLKISNQKLKTKRKKMRLDLSIAQVKKHERYGPENELKNEIQVFSPTGEQLYSEFFEAINRQDDTFYVVSFSEQHMLLPALHHNKTRRPKMSLLMPSMFPNETSTQTYIPLMQIDCEVLDTKLVHVKYGSIPRPYRQYGTNSSDASKSRADNSTSSRKYSGSKKAYKPYFLSKNVLKAVDFN